MRRPAFKYPANKTFISIDMDAFYCGVEQKLDPSLVGEPFVVGQKNCAATVSYAARALGIKKLSKVADIKREFPNIRIVNGESLAKYRTAGLEILNFLTQFVPHIERLGLEEFRFEITDELAAAYKPLRRVFRTADDSDVAEPFTFSMFDQNITAPNFFWAANCTTYPPSCNGFFSEIPPESYLAAQFAEYLMARIKLDLGYDCSIGIASSKHYAKMATSCNKPRGCHLVLPGYESEFVKGRQVSSVPGLGYNTQQMLLEKFHIEKTDLVSKLLEVKHVLDPEIQDLITGVDKSEIKPWEGPTQISKEETFSPYIMANKCLPTINMLVDNLLAQAKGEMMVDGKWIKPPLKFRVITATNNIRGQGRRAKTISLNQENGEPDFPKLAKHLVRNGYSMLQELIDEPLRVLNVALLFKL